MMNNLIFFNKERLIIVVKVLNGEIVMNFGLLIGSLDQLIQNQNCFMRDLIIFDVRRNRVSLVIVLVNVMMLNKNRIIVFLGLNNMVQEVFNVNMLEMVVMMMNMMSNELNMVDVMVDNIVKVDMINVLLLVIEVMLKLKVNMN